MVRFRSPLLTESRFLSLPRGTEMFQFPRYAPGATRKRVALDDGLSDRRVSPFGNRRIKAWLRLPDAYRSNPRPSSPVKQVRAYDGCLGIDLSLIHISEPTRRS